MKKYLGLDSSTQSLSAVLISVDEVSQKGEICLSESVNFEKDLPSYGTKAGHDLDPKNPSEVWSYPKMWLDALDLLMEKLAQKTDLSQIDAISASGQQHGSVWLNSQKAFENLDAKKSLSQNISSFFSMEKSPIWMDSSTSLECAEITERAGGQGEVLSRTGSVAIERFTGAQIRKIFKQKADIYANTKRIHLVSSFICSVLCGKDAPIDFGDGAGMNMMNVKSFSWDEKMLSSICETSLENKLPHLVPSNSLVGEIAEYFCEKFGFKKGAKVAVSTGDNPSSLVGVGAMLEGNAVISLGTSDTFFASSKTFSPCPQANVFGNPAGGYMSLMCFRNGSLAREKLKNSLGVDWKFFDETAFENYFPKIDENFILPFYFDEICPPLKSSDIVFAGKNEEEYSPSEKIAEFLSAQFMNMRAHAIAMTGGVPKFIALTGGASKSAGIRRLIADVFGAETAKMESENSAALGAAMRAANALDGYSWESLAKMFCKMGEVEMPRKDFAKVYEMKTPLFEKCVSKIYGL